MPLFVLFRVLFSLQHHIHFQFQHYKFKSHRWCVWDSNPWPQDGRPRRNRRFILILSSENKLISSQQEEVFYCIILAKAIFFVSRSNDCKVMSFESTSMWRKDNSEWKRFRERHKLYSKGWCLKLSALLKIYFERITH